MRLDVVMKDWVELGYIKGGAAFCCKLVLYIFVTRLAQTHISPPPIMCNYATFPCILKAVNKYYEFSKVCSNGAVEAVFSNGSCNIHHRFTRCV